MSHAVQTTVAAELYQRLLDRLDLAVVVHTRAHEVLYANQAFATMFGYPLDDGSAGACALDALPQAQRDSVNELLDKLWDDDTKQKSHVHQMRAMDGTSIWVRVNEAAAVVGDDEVGIAIVEDHSEIRWNDTVFC